MAKGTTRGGTTPITPTAPVAGAAIGAEGIPPLDPGIDTSLTPRDRVNDTGLYIGNRYYLAQRRSDDTGGHRLDILPDLPDIRDRIYQPHLQRLEPQKAPRIAFDVRDQGEENSCVGFALAHVIDVLRHSDDSERAPQRASARMLYEMARRNDEWAESPHEGSSLRGGIKGFFRNGVCGEDVPGANAENWKLTYRMAKAARETRLGAYFRLQPDISDYHAGLQEVGALYCSAQIHTNWLKPKAGKIAVGGTPIGGHAFVIVGYDAEGFWVLNSWGRDWGDKGLAHWSYDDWAATVMDAWLLQLGVRAPAAFSAIPGSTPSSRSGLFGIGDPTRADILGHFINIDDGRLIETGKYASPRKDEMLETVKRLTRADSNKGAGYSDLVIYAHGGLNSQADEARRIAAWKRTNIFGRNTIYNFHLMWSSDFFDEAFGRMSESTAGLSGGGISDWLFETGPGKALGYRAWRNMKGDADAAFNGHADYDGGMRGLAPLLQGLDKAALRPRIHLVGHSAGSIVLGRLLSAFERFGLANIDIQSIHLMAPACTVAFFNDHYGRLLAGKGDVRLEDKIYLYILNDALEQKDTVEAGIPFTPRYSHSLLYLVSRAYEEVAKTPLAGMEIYQSLIKASKKLQVDLSPGPFGKTTRATSHGGFDNDATTMTTIMARILGKAPKTPPKQSEMEGY